MVQIAHKNALVCAVQQVYVCRQVKDYDFSDRLAFCSLLIVNHFCDAVGCLTCLDMSCSDLLRFPGINAATLV